MTLPEWLEHRFAPPRPSVDAIRRLIRLGRIDATNVGRCYYIEAGAEIRPLEDSAPDDELPPAPKLSEKAREILGLS